MELSKAIRKRIKYYLDKNNMNVWNLCKNSGIPCSTISTFMSGKTGNSISIYIWCNIICLLQQTWIMEDDNKIVNSYK